MKIKRFALAFVLVAVLVFNPFQTAENRLLTFAEQRDIFPNTFLDCKLVTEEPPEEIPEGVKSMIAVSTSKECESFILTAKAIIFKPGLGEEEFMEKAEDMMRDTFKEPLIEYLRDQYPEATPELNYSENPLPDHPSRYYELEEISIENIYYSIASWRMSGEESQFGPTVYLVDLAGPEYLEINREVVEQFIRESVPPPISEGEVPPPTPQPPREPEKEALIYEESISDWTELRCGEHSTGEYVVRRPCTGIFRRPSSISNFILEVDVRDRSVCSFKPGAGEYGLIFGDHFKLHLQEPNGAKGKFKLTHQGEIILNWTKSEHIDVTCGSYNHLRVATRGSAVWLYVNGYLMASFDTKGSSIEGAVGIFSNSNREIRFNNFKIYAIKGTKPQGPSANIIRKVNITVHYDNWDYDVWMNMPAKVTWYLYDMNKNLVHTYTHKYYTTHAGGTFGGYIPGGQDGYIQLMAVNKKGEVDWWPGKDQMYKIER